MAPPTGCIVADRRGALARGLRKEIVQGRLLRVHDAPPAVYRGNPFRVEAALAYGREGDTMEVTEGGKIIAKKKAAAGETELLGHGDEPIRVVRFANRVPLQYQQSALCGQQGRDGGQLEGLRAHSSRRAALPYGPMVLIVHIASVWVPFTSESKEAIASYPEILKEIRLAVQECGRKLGTHIRKGRKIAREHQEAQLHREVSPAHRHRPAGDPGHQRQATRHGRRELRGMLERSRKI